MRNLGGDAAGNLSCKPKRFSLGLDLEKYEVCEK